jgi:hypothetical protein
MGIYYILTITAAPEVQEACTEDEDARVSDEEV